MGCVTVRQFAQVQHASLNSYFPEGGGRRIDDARKGEQQTDAIQRVQPPGGSLYKPGPETDRADFACLDHRHRHSGRLVHESLAKLRFQLIPRTRFRSIAEHYAERTASF
jgi:hypothetical protein